MNFLNLLKKFNYNTTISYNNVENERLRAISTRFRDSNEDTVFISTSRICPECSKYNHRIFSLYGRYKAFPILPTFLYRNRCPICNTCIGFSHYFPNISRNLRKDITNNQKPLIDSRTSNECKIWDNNIKADEDNLTSEKDYKWILENLPELAPKSFAGYKRMRSSNSKNYQKLTLEAKKRGYTIK